MSTNCKLVIGHTDHTGHWVVENEYIRWKDGYTEAIKPLLHQFKGNVDEMNENARYESWKFEEFSGDTIVNPEFVYLLDISNLMKVKCSILAIDWDFYYKYGVDSYKVVCEGIL